jgi:penicillin-binding protein 2
MAKYSIFENHYSEIKLYADRAFAALIIALGAFAILLANLIYLQILQYDYYASYSASNRINLTPIPPNRGVIYDRNGTILAENRPIHQLELFPEKLSNLKETLANLQKILPISNPEIQRFYDFLKKRRRFEGVPLKINMNDLEMAEFAVNRHHFLGVEMVPRLLRYYPKKDLFTPALGYVGRINEKEMESLDIIEYGGTQHMGKLGIEKYYEVDLHGKVGKKEVEMDSHGRLIRVLKEYYPTPGDNLYLTLDSGLQEKAFQILENKRGAIVAIDPRNGEILTLASNPSYDPNLFVTGIPNDIYQNLRLSPDQPLFNRALRGQYPLASTIKPMLALKALDENIITPETTIYDEGWFEFEHRRYRDWVKTGHGTVNMHKAIVQSCDVYFYRLANQLGIDRIDEIGEDFGLGQLTQVDLTDELAGLLPSRAWKRRVKKEPWFPGETLSAGIGQGFWLATPLQMAQMATILANRGVRVQPHLLHKRVTPSGIAIQTTIQKKKLSIAANQAAWETISAALQDVIENPRGTAHRLSNKTYTVAGKTGTAQVFSVKQNEKYVHAAVKERLRDHTLFMGYAPADHPTIAVAVVIENQAHTPSTGSAGAKQLLDYYFSQKSVKNSINQEPSLRNDTHGTSASQ